MESASESFLILECLHEIIRGLAFGHLSLEKVRDEFKLEIERDKNKIKFKIKSKNDQTIEQIRSGLNTILVQNNKKQARYDLKMY